MQPSILASQQDLRDAWPGDRVPAPTDAEIAYKRLDTRSIGVFKQAMLADAQAREQKPYLRPGSVHALQQQASYPAELPWPSSFFFASLPQEHVNVLQSLDTLVQACHDLFLCRAPFLKDLPANVFMRTKRPDYLTLAMASVGSLLMQQTNDASVGLWRTASRQLLGNVDVDNTLTRKMDFVKAWILLETFSILHADRMVWREAAMMHVCVKTAVWRILLETPYSDVSHASRNDSLAAGVKVDRGRSLISYFLLIALLRVIQHGQNALLPTNRFLQLIQMQSTGMATSASLLATQQISDEPLLSLISLLADAHLLATCLAPLDLSTTSNTTMSQHIPFSTASEVEELKQKLWRQLRQWTESCAHAICQDVLLLYHFSHLYSLVSVLPTLFVSSEFVPCDIGTCRADEAALGALVESPGYSAAMDVAWEVLETSELVQTHEVPIWAPLSVFAAGLVVWARTRFANPDSLSTGTGRSLIAFHRELNRMGLPSATEMAATLARLGSFKTAKR